ncbi:MAG: 30S ribosomal protein S6 [Bacteroidota bacterium]|nr:30S ribosomal protein S6 [Bacteroidota bacterium]
MEKTKRNYETTFIVNASLDDPVIDGIIEKVQEQINRYGGEITAINKWGRKRLVYPIKKKNNGYYAFIEFIAPGTAIQQIEKFYKLDENIIRYLTIQLDKRALKAQRQLPIPVPDIEDILDTIVLPDKEPLFDDEEKIS